MVLAIAACSEEGTDQSRGESRWPPARPDTVSSIPDSLIGKLQMGSGDFGQGWGYVFRDSAMSRQVGWGPLIASGTLDLPFCLFNIERPIALYAPNQYEVIDFDSSMTRVRIEAASGDQVCMWLDDDRGIFHTPSDALLYAGSRVRLSGQVYELRKDGWYLTGQCVHAFAPDSTEE